MDDATVAAAPAYDDAPPFTDADRRARAGRAPRPCAQVTDVGPDDLVALSPDEAGAAGRGPRRDCRAAPRQRSPSSSAPRRRTATRSSPCCVAAATLPADDARRGALVRAVALATPLRLRSALDEVGADPALDEVLAQVAAVRTELAAGPPYRWWGAPEMTMAEPPGSDDGGDPDDPGETVFRDGEATRKSYARLDVAGTERPDVVVVDQPFEVTLGLQSRKDGGLVASSPLVLQVGETVELDVVLLHDPTSIEVTGSPRARITVTDLAPFPTVTMTCTARYGEELAPERRLGLQMRARRPGRRGRLAHHRRRRDLRRGRRRDGAGAARRHPARPRPAARASSRRTWSSRCAAPTPAARPSSGRRTPPTRPCPSPTCRAPARSTTTPPPSRPRPGGRSSSPPTRARTTSAWPAGPGASRGRSRRACRTRCAPSSRRPGRTSAPAVLLLTEELTIPWELAALDPDLTSAWGGTSPFLGAHAAIARWPLSEHKPRPRPQSTVAVRTGAVLTADYTGVSGWGRLESAVAEAAEVATLFDPPATPVTPGDLGRHRPVPRAPAGRRGARRPARAVRRPGRPGGHRAAREEPGRGRDRPVPDPGRARERRARPRPVRLPQRLPGRHRRAGARRLRRVRLDPAADRRGRRRGAALERQGRRGRRVRPPVLRRAPSALPSRWPWPRRCARSGRRTPRRASGRGPPASTRPSSPTRSSDTHACD